MKKREAHRLKNNWSYAQKVWKQQTEKYPILTNWSLQKKSMLDKIGFCDYNHRLIVISSIFMRGATCNYKKVKQALMHEIAHALTPGHQHNQTWKQVCEKIGGDTRLKGTVDMPGRNWSLYCLKCKWRQEYLDKPDISNMVCISCKTQPRLKYIF